MFGSLVVVFPTPHEGGALFLRHHGREWVFDSGQALAAIEEQPAIGYVAFFSDIEHEVAPVTSGHRITLTYNLYFDEGGPISERDAVSEHLIPPQPSNQEAFYESFKALLANQEFMADGGTLAFGLRHVYPIKKSLEHVYNVLKGSDAVVYQSVRALGFEAVLYVYYDDEESNTSGGAMVDKVIKFYDVADDETVREIVHQEGGVLVRQDGGEQYDDPYFQVAEPVEWVTPVTTYNRQEGAFASHGNEPTLNWAYGDVCMIVRIGKAGDRLAYPTVAQVKKAFKESRIDRNYYYD